MGSIPGVFGWHPAITGTLSGRCYGGGTISRAGGTPSSTQLPAPPTATISCAQTANACGVCDVAHATGFLPAALAHFRRFCALLCRQLLGYHCDHIGTIKVPLVFIPENFKLGMLCWSNALAIAQGIYKKRISHTIAIFAQKCARFFFRSRRVNAPAITLWCHFAKIKKK